MQQWTLGLKMKWEELSKGDQGLWIGVAQGWWEWVDMDRRQPIPFPTMIDSSMFNEKGTMAHVLAFAGVFDSVSEARRAGWNKPITLGEHWFKNRTIRIVIFHVTEE